MKKEEERLPFLLGAVRAGRDSQVGGGKGFMSIVVAPSSSLLTHGMGAVVLNT